MFDFRQFLESNETWEQREVSALLSYKRMKRIFRKPSKPQN